MITLYGAGPFFGLPDPSPFAMKAETLLRMSKLPFDKKQMSRSKAPKGKIPYIEDDGKLLGDSTFIRWHLEQKYRIDFDAMLTAEQRAVAWAFEKMAEDHLYWAIIDTRWTDSANFARGPEDFFRAAPAPIRPLVMAMIKRQVRKALHSHGMGRHSPNEIAALGSRSLGAIADYLADKPFFMGVEPTGADATIFAFVAGAMCPVFKSPIQQAAASHDNLRGYVSRMTARFYPERDEIAGCKAAA
jgi:glutathione S-transferase